MSLFTGVMVFPVASVHGSGLDDFPEGILIIACLNTDHPTAGGRT